MRLPDRQAVLLCCARVLHRLRQSRLRGWMPRRGSTCSTSSRTCWLTCWWQSCWIWRQQGWQHCPAMHWQPQQLQQHRHSHCVCAAAGCRDPHLLQNGGCDLRMYSTGHCLMKRCQFRCCICSWHLMWCTVLSRNAAPPPSPPGGL